MKPKRSYIIWFSQRTGSSLLCKALESTKIAGQPKELLNVSKPNKLYTRFQVSTPGKLQDAIWHNGSSENCVFGIKYGFYESFHSELTKLFRQFPNVADNSSSWDVWNNAFPNCKHIFMTRRNKVRQAVSWWKAIKSGEWHRKVGSSLAKTDLDAAYNFEAIDRLLMEATLREAGIQEFLFSGGIIPHTVTYEDLILDFEETIEHILEFLDLSNNCFYSIDVPYYEQLADDISEQWIQRYRKERQSGWKNRGW